MTHKMVLITGGAGEGTWGGLKSNLLLKVWQTLNSEQIAQGFMKPVLKTSKDRDHTKSFGQLVPML